MFDAQGGSAPPRGITGRFGHERVVLACLLAVFLCRAAVANVVVPPWQGSDEPGHFAVAYGLTLPTDMQQRVEAGVIASMLRHGWWDYRSDPPPDPLPTSFQATPGVGGGLLVQPLYYSLGALVLSGSGPADLEAAYVHLRVLGVFLAVVTLVAGWAGSRLLFGPQIAAGATAIAAFHPQFLLASIAVNADVLLNAWGAFVWWQAARVVTGRRRDFSMALMLIGAVAALFTKRIGMVLVGVAAVVVVSSLLANQKWRWRWRDAVLVAATVAIAAAVVLVLGLVFEEPANQLRLYWADVFAVRRTVESATLAESLRFVRMTVDYFWLIAGWLRFQPPEAWIWVARILTLAAIVGIAFVMIESPSDRPRMSFALLFTIAQLGSMLVAVFWIAPSAPQARYMFPAFIPITVLLYVGWHRTVAIAFPQHWPALLVVVLVLLDVTGFAMVHIPAYIH